MKKGTLLIAALALCTAANFVRLSAQEEAAPADVVTTTEEATSRAPEPEASSYDVTAESFSSSDLGSQAPAAFEDILFESAQTRDDAGADVRFDIGVDRSAVTQGVITFTDAALFGDPDASQTPDVASGTAESVPMSALANPLAAQGHVEAVVDLSEVFRRSDYFAEETAQLKVRVAELQERLRIYQEEAQRKQQMLEDLEGERREELQHEIIELRILMETTSQTASEEMRKAEGVIYLNTYRRVRAAIAEYAQEHGIHTVRRVSAGISDDEMDTQEILAWINSDVIYSADEPRDITEDVIARLNGDEPQTSLLPSVGPGYAAPPPPMYRDSVPAVPPSTTPYGPSQVPQGVPGGQPMAPGTAAPPIPALPGTPSATPAQVPGLPSATPSQVPTAPEAVIPPVAPTPPIGPGASNNPIAPPTPAAPQTQQIPSNVPAPVQP